MMPSVMPNSVAGNAKAPNHRSPPRPKYVLFNFFHYLARYPKLPLGSTSLTGLCILCRLRHSRGGHMAAKVWLGFVRDPFI